MLIIRHKNGLEKRVTDRAYRIMPASLRKSWEVVRRVDDGGKPGTAGAKDMKLSPSFLPEEIEEGVASEEHKAKNASEAASMSGEPVAATVSAAPQPPAAHPVTSKPEVQAAPAAAAAQGVKADGGDEPIAQQRADDLAILPNMGAKAAEALNAGGIRTYEQLAAATTPDLNAMLDKSNLGAKRAQVPQWKSKAADLAKTKK